MSSAAGTRAVLFAEIVGLARSLPRRFYLKHARNSNAAVFWIPAFAGLTSCPPFDFAEDRLRRASSVHSVWETRYGPCSGRASRVRSAHQIAGAKKPVRKRTLHTGQFCCVFSLSRWERARVREQRHEGDRAGPHPNPLPLTQEREKKGKGLT